MERKEVMDKDLFNLMKQNNDALDRVAKSNYLLFMQAQESEKRNTPTSTAFGTYGFNPTNSNTQVAKWVQLMPRNTRRKRLTLSSLNQTLYFSIGGIAVGINELIVAQNTGFAGHLPVMQFTFTAGNRLPIETTESIWCASIVGAGSIYEQQATVSWAEEIYSSPAANPIGSDVRSLNVPNSTQKLTFADMDLDGDVRSHFTREGVR